MMTIRAGSRENFRPQAWSLRVAVSLLHKLLTLYHVLRVMSQHLFRRGGPGI